MKVTIRVERPLSSNDCVIVIIIIIIVLNYRVVRVASIWIG